MSAFRPKVLGDDQRINLLLRPPILLGARRMERPMMDRKERYEKTAVRQVWMLGAHRLKLIRR